MLVIPYIAIVPFYSFDEKISTYLSTFQPENPVFNKHIEPQPKKGCAYKKKCVVLVKKASKDKLRKSSMAGFFLLHTVKLFKLRFYKTI